MAEQNNKDAEQPKIIIDDDWKAQAQAEKEKLSEKIEAESATAPATEQGAAEDGPRQLPPANFATLVNSLVAQTLMTLGGVEDPETKKRYVDLDLAKHHIDMLSVIDEKTKGNLTDEEKKLLDTALYEIRMQYLQIAQHATRG